MQYFHPPLCLFLYANEYFIYFISIVFSITCPFLRLYFVYHSFPDLSWTHFSVTTHRVKITQSKWFHIFTIIITTEKAISSACTRSRDILFHTELKINRVIILARRNGNGSDNFLGRNSQRAIKTKYKPQNNNYNNESNTQKTKVANM